MLKILPTNQVLLQDLDRQSGARIQKQIMKSRKMGLAPETEIMAMLKLKIHIMKLRCPTRLKRRNTSINNDPDHDLDHMTIITIEIKAKK